MLSPCFTHTPLMNSSVVVSSARTSPKAPSLFPKIWNPDHLSSCLWFSTRVCPRQTSVRGPVVPTLLWVATISHLGTAVPLIVPPFLFLPPPIHSPHGGSRNLVFIDHRYHKMNHLKIYNSVAFSIFKMLYSYHFLLFPKGFCYPRGKLYPWSSHFPFSLFPFLWKSIYLLCGLT